MSQFTKIMPQSFPLQEHRMERMEGNSNANGKTTVMNKKRKQKMKDSCHTDKMNIKKRKLYETGKPSISHSQLNGNLVSESPRPKKKISQVSMLMESHNGNLVCKSPKMKKKIAKTSVSLGSECNDNLLCEPRKQCSLVAVGTESQLHKKISNSPRPKKKLEVDSMDDLSTKTLKTKMEVDTKLGKKRKKPSKLKRKKKKGKEANIINDGITTSTNSPSVNAKIFEKSGILKNSVNKLQSTETQTDRKLTKRLKRLLRQTVNRNNKSKVVSEALSLLKKISKCKKSDLVQAANGVVGDKIHASITDKRKSENDVEQDLKENSKLSPAYNGETHSNGGQNSPQDSVADEKNGKGSKVIDPSKYVALDCEFVGVGPGKRSALGRCSIVDYDGHVIYDMFVRPDECITDYRTPWSGIQKHHMKDAISFSEAQQQVRDIIKEKVVVGHAVCNDFRVLDIPHPKEDIRDTSWSKTLKIQSGYPQMGGVSLKKLSSALLGRTIQNGEHCSVEDARATMELFKLLEGDWKECIRLHPPSPSPSCSNKRFLDDHFWPDNLDEH